MKFKLSVQTQKIFLGALLFSLLTSSLPAQEKQLSYTFNSQPFTSLAAADQYMRNNTWSWINNEGQIDPSAHWLQFFYKQNGSPPYFFYRFHTDDWTENPGFKAFKTPFGSKGSTCPSDCPNSDAFGNDFCTTYTGAVCQSDTAIMAKILETYSKPGCPATVVELPSYQKLLINGSPNPAVWPFSGNANLIQESGYSQYQGDFKYTAYPSSCSSPQEWTTTIYPLTSVECPVGWNRYSSEGSGVTAKAKCWNELLARIYETGAVTPEPTMECREGNPCHPTTGNKTLVETDFRSTSLSFTRSYHSMSQYDDFASMGRGWTHTYSQRILDFPDAAITSKKLMDGQGNIEYFECTDAPDCNQYRSLRRAGSLLQPINGGWRLRSPAGEVRSFDADGKLLSIEQTSGAYVLLTLTYGARNKIEAVTDQFGRQLSFTYNSDGLLQALQLPSGEFITYEYTNPYPPVGGSIERQSLIKVVREDLTERIYHYEHATHKFLLTGITDELGVRYATYAYDSRARVSLSQHALGAGAITLNYTNRTGDGLNWSVTEVTHPLGEVTTYDMDAGPFRKLRSKEDSRGTYAMAYDPVTSWRSSKIDRENHKTTYQYDNLHEIRRTEAVGTPAARVIESDWNNTVNRVAELREPGTKTSYTYNNRGQVLTRTVTDTATLATRRWTYTYYETPALGPLIGQVQSVNGPRTDVSDITTYEYYTSDHPNGYYLIGDLKAVVNALGHHTDYLKYDFDGRPVLVQDPNGVLTSLTYHARGWISSRTTDEKTTAIIYDAAGNLTRFTQPDGSFMAYDYDDAHRMTALEDNYGNRIEYTLDADGNHTAENTFDEHAVLRRQMSRVYDQLSRMTTLLDGNSDATSFGYDNNGNRVDTTDANSNITSFEYDGLNRLVKTIDSLLGETVMAYDARDNLVGVTDPLGNLTQYTYDGLKNHTELDSPDTHTTTYEHDTAGNRTAATDARNVRTDYVYDALNRLTGINYPDISLDVSFTYDVGSNGIGRLTRMTDAAGVVDYTYDARGNLLTETRTNGMDQYVTAYGYNTADRLVQMTYPSGMIIDYSLDAAGRITAVDKTVDSVTEPLASGIQYQPFGPVSSFTYGNELSYSADFDLDYELDQLQSSNGLDWLLGYDPVGNILNITDLVRAPDSQTFTYDDLYRLDTAAGAYGGEDFHYDANGNRTRYRNGIVDEPYAYQPDSNRLASQNGWAFVRDAAGNRTAKLDPDGMGQLYTFSDHGRLVQTSFRDAVGDTVVGDYVYDGRGQRMIKTADAVTTHYVYGLSGELLGEYVLGTDENLSEYVYLNGQPISVYSTQTQTIPPAPEYVTIDNDDAETSSTGKWQLKSNKNDYGPDYRLGNGTDTYRWTAPSLIGTFGVYAWWVSNKKNSKVAHYTIIHSGGEDVVVKGQNENGGDWELLGTFVFDGSAGETVMLHSGDGDKISADAIRFIQVGGGGGGDGVVTTATHFIHGDHLGTPRQVSNTEQDLVWRWDSQPFGDSAPDEDPDGDLETFTLNLRFPGQYADMESGLYYNYFRTYDPSAGRYIESDPIGLQGGLNTFGYVGANPLHFRDSFGLCKVEARCNLLSAGRLLGKDISHCFIVVTEPGGGSSYFRGGPSGNGGTISAASSNSHYGTGVGGDSGYGNIVTDSGAYVPESIDWPTGSTPSTGSKTYINNDKPCDCIENQLKRGLQDIQSANTPYNPLTTNSNSAAFQALRGIGIAPGSAPAPAPGWGVPLPSNGGGSSEGQCCDQ